MKVSIIIPSKGCAYLSYLMRGLRDQTIRPSEVILVVKSCDLRSVESLCGKFSLSCTIIEQRKGYFTHVLNIGKREARGDLILITDEDAIPLKGWVERYIELHTAYARKTINFKRRNGEPKSMSKALHKRSNHSRKSTDKEMNEAEQKYLSIAVLVMW